MSVTPASSLFFNRNSLVLDYKPITLIPIRTTVGKLENKVFIFRYVYAPATRLPRLPGFLFEKLLKEIETKILFYDNSAFFFP